MEKRRGGLGLRHAKYQNQSLLMKMGWQMVKRRDALWVKVMRDKYRCGDAIFPDIDSKRSGSVVWAGIKKTWEKVKSGIELKEDSSNAIWKWERNGIFSVKSAYTKLSQEHIDPSPMWGHVWKLQVPQRYRTFLWLASRKSLLTNASRQRKGLTNDGTYPVCRCELEDTIHVL